MLKIIAGIDYPDSGEVVFRNECRVTYLQQDVSFDNDLTINQLISSTHNKISLLVGEYEKAVETHSKENSIISEKNLALITQKMDKENAWDYDRRSRQILTKFNISNFEKKFQIYQVDKEKRIIYSSYAFRKCWCSTFRWTGKSFWYSYDWMVRKYL